MNYTISIDIGGTTFSFVIFLKKNIIFKSNIYDIKKYNNHSEFLIKLSTLIKKEINENKINLIGVACPGPLNSETGEILNTPNLKFLQYVNLIDEMKKYIKCEKIYIENDANVFAIGSYNYLKNTINFNSSDILLGVTLGTGMGFGIIINEKLFKGSYGMAGEYELSPLDKDLTWANLVGYKFFQKKTKKIFGKVLNPKDLYDLAERNNLKSIKIWEEYGKNIGLCLTHVMCVINPNYISIGGGISKGSKYFHNSLIKILEDKCLVYKKDLVNIFYDVNDISNIFLGWI
jgi:glucokinase